MNNKTLVWRGLLDALATVIYIILVATFMNHAEQILGKGDTFLTPVVVLTLFVLSALITSSLVLGKPVMLYLDGEKRAGIKLTLYTTASLAVIWVIVILAYWATK